MLRNFKNIQSRVIFMEWILCLPILYFYLTRACLSPQKTLILDLIGIERIQSKSNTLDCQGISKNAGFLTPDGRQTFDDVTCHHVCL